MPSIKVKDGQFTALVTDNDQEQDTSNNIELVLSGRKCFLEQAAAAGFGSAGRLAGYNPKEGCFLTVLQF